MFVLKLKSAPADLGRRLVSEVWLCPDGLRIVELSTRCATTEALQVAAEMRMFLSGCGVDPTGEPQTKTRTAMVFFARGLAGAAPADAAPAAG